MDLMVNPQITGFRQDVDGTIKELKIGSNKEDAWANIAEQGASAKLDNNKTATIDVSAYTTPVEVKPTSGKDGMKKATITLSNIPSPTSRPEMWRVVGNYSDAPDGFSHYYASKVVDVEVDDTIIRACSDSSANDIKWLDDITVTSVQQDASGDWYASFTVDGDNGSFYFTKSGS